MPDRPIKDGEKAPLNETQKQELVLLLEEFRRQAYSIALRITKNPADAEDVLQESLLKAYQNLPRFRGESSLSTWLGSIVTNQAITALRQRSSRNEISLDKGSPKEDRRESIPVVVDRGDSPEAGAINAEFREIIARTIDELDEKLHVIFMLREMGGFSVEELAEVLELSVPAAKSRLFVARKRLHERLRRRVGRSSVTASESME